MEPILVRPHVEWKPECEGRQAIIHCGSGIGLSVVTAKGTRWEHGLYCDDNTYEIAPIRFTCEVPELDPMAFTLVEDETPEGDVMGWLTIEEVGRIADAMSRDGLDGFRRSNGALMLETGE